MAAASVAAAGLSSFSRRMVRSSHAKNCRYWAPARQTAMRRLSALISKELHSCSAACKGSACKQRSDLDVLRCHSYHVADLADVSSCEVPSISLRKQLAGKIRSYDFNLSSDLFAKHRSIVYCSCIHTACVTIQDAYMHAMTK